MCHLKYKHYISLLFNLPHSLLFHEFFIGRPIRFTVVLIGRFFVTVTISIKLPGLPKSRPSVLDPTIIIPLKPFLSRRIY